MDVISEKTDVLKILPEAAEELCSALFRNSPAGIYITRNGKFIYTNIEFRRITGYSQDELFGKDYQRLVNPRYRQKPKQNTSLFLFGEADSSSHEFKITTHDDKKKWISEKITYFKYGGNWLTLGHWLDITDQHAVEKAWHEAERRFQSAFEDLSTGLTIISTDGIFLKANKAFYDMVGYTEKEILESRFDEVIHPDERADSSDLMQLFLSLAKPEDSIQRRLVSSEGRTIWTAMNISLIGDSEDAPSYFIVHFQDITEQKRIEDGLREEEALYRALVDRSLEPVAALDLDCHFTHISHKFLEILGYATAADILGKKISALVAGQQDTDMEQLILSILREGKPARLQQSLVKQDGSLMPVELNISWIDNDMGSPACVVVSFKDQSIGETETPPLQDKQLHVYENINTAIALVDENTIITSVNAAFEKLSGYTREEIEGKKSWVEFVDREDLSRLKRYHILRRLDPESAPDMYEFKFSTRDGQAKNVLINISAAPGNGTTVAALLDLTSLRWAEKGLSEQWDSLTSFMNTLPTMMCFKDTRGRIVRVNRRFADFLGRPGQDIEGKTMAELMPDRAEQFDLCDSEIVQGREPHVRVIWQIPLEGGLRSVRFDKTPLVDADGEIRGVMVEGIDITDHTSAEISLQEKLDKLEKTLNGSIQAMATIVEMRDPFTIGHQQRVASLSGAIAQQMGLAEEQAFGVIIASKIHDIGKVYVPMEILSKPGGLSDTERQIIKSHSAGGYDILKPIDFPWPVAQAIYQHHERLDGSGYPLGLRGADIILEARIIMVADVVEAMSSHRPYRPALSVESALTEITGNSGILYDAEVVDACVRLFREKAFSFDSEPVDLP
jgi:PAS domain S-box-containing protein